MSYKSYENLSWDEASKISNYDGSPYEVAQTALEEYNSVEYKIFKMSIAARQAADILFQYDADGKQDVMDSRLDKVGEFLLHYSYKSNIAREVLRHCSAQSIKDNRDNLLSYFLSNYDWILPSFAIDAYDRLYFDALTSSACYDKETRETNPDLVKKYSNSHTNLEWRERPKGVFVDYEKQVDEEFLLKLYLNDEVDVVKLSRYLENNIEFLRNINIANNKLREQLIFNTAVTWLCSTTAYSNKTIFRIVFTIFSKDDKLKIFLPTRTKEDEEPISAKIRMIRSTMNKDIKNDWFNIAREELESDRKMNQELYNLHYSANPAGFFFERFNLAFDKKTKKFHLSALGK